ncbi:MAG TPA: CidA/LrgA family protein [Acetobacteraceae bacterium]|nr:CidA/LrgA family protein [Acetobacteraceae bacterium]
MIGAFCLLLVCQLAGTVIAHAAGWPVPGPVLGLILLLVLLVIRGGPSTEVHGLAQGLLRNLGLLFVPAGVGIVSEGAVLRENALAIAIAIPVSTVIAFSVTGLVMQYFARADR